MLWLGVRSDVSQRDSLARDEDIAPLQSVSVLFVCCRGLGFMFVKNETAEPQQYVCTRVCKKV